MEQNMEGLSYIQTSTRPLQSLTTYEDETTAKFMCIVCRKTFYNSIALQNHKKLQHDQVWTCLSDSDQRDRDDDEDYLKRVCGFQFIPREDANDDKVTIQEDGTMIREFSEDTTYLIVKMEEEDLDAVKRRRLEGLVKKTKMKPGKQHIDLRGPFTCTSPSALRPDIQCRQIFFNCCEYSLHYREEHTKRRKAALRCQVCEKRLDGEVFPPNIFVQPIALSTYPFSCSICQQIFLNGADFDEHNRTLHAKMKPHQCSICYKRFTQQGGLQQHMRMHSGIRPFACTFCPKAFTQKAGLDQHLRTHTKIKPFKCVICGKCFSQSVHLRQHMRTHTNIQPFECTFCGKRFKQSSHLNFHLRSHVGDPNALIGMQAEPPSQLDFLNLSNIQPVDGEALYYTADLNTGPLMEPNSFIYTEVKMSI